MKLGKVALCATSCVAALLSVPAGAQTGDQTTSDAPVSIGNPVATAKLAADQDRDPDDRGNEIIVTGTRIVRPNNRAAAPIVTVTSADIAAQGATNVEEVLNRLPQVQANGEQNYGDTNSGGRQRVKLRSLGFERTLTLIDGLRVGQRNQFDVGIVPTALVERIDVLTGGASSVYGSDAISGVVNFILKKNFDGINLAANYSFFNHQNRQNAVTDAAERAFLSRPLGMTNDGGTINATLSLGKNLFDDAVNITGFVNYRHADLLPLGSRSYSACEVTQATRDGPLGCSLGSYTAAGTIIPASGPRTGQRLVNTSNGTFALLNSGPGRTGNPFDGLAFQREFERINSGGFLTARISDEIELYSTALFYRDRSRNPRLRQAFSYLTFGSTPYTVNCNNPFLSVSQASDLCGANPAPGATAAIDVRYRFDGLPPLNDTFENKGARITAGLRGRVLDDVWNYDIAGVYAWSRSFARTQAISDFDRVNRSLQVVNRNGVPTCQSVINGTDPNCVPFNAFAPFNNNAALNDYLYYSPFGSQATVPIMWQGVSTLSGDLGKYGITSPFAEEGVAIAFGGEFRSEIYKSTADAAFRATSGGRDARFTQNVWEVNTEVQAPLVEKQRWTELLQVNAGYRVSRYNRLSSVFRTWKIEGLWGPVADITFRGSYNKAQTAPTVTQAASASVIEYVTVGSRNDPCASTPNPSATDPNRRAPPTATLEECRRTGLPDNLYGSASLSCPDGSCTIRNGGFGLTPETAYTKTFGVILRPRFIPGLTVSIDRFLIDLNDSINYFSANDFLNNCLATGLDYYCRGVVRNPGSFTLASPVQGNPATGFLAQGLSNGFKSNSHGWDFQAQYGLALGGAGRIDMSFNGSLMTLVGGQDSPEVAPRNCVGYYGPFCGESLPKWKHGLQTTWASPDSTTHLTVNWRHIGPMTISYNATDPDLGIPVTAADRRTTYTGVDAYDYIDLAASFDVAKRFTFRISVNNLFDRDPPLVPNSRSILGLLRANTMFNYDLLGRQIVFGINARF